MESIRVLINQTDWHSFVGPDAYDPDQVAPALMNLLDFDDSSAPLTSHRFLSLVSNNHRGTYFPAMLVAVDILIAISELTDVPKRTAFCIAVLQDLAYFEPEVGDYEEKTNEELAAIVSTKLSAYRNEG